MVPVRTTLLVLIVISTIAAACDSGSSGASRAAPNSSPSARRSPDSPAPDCPNQDEVVSTPEALRPGRMTGDVDGDGADDTLLLAVDPDSPQGCRAFIVVETATGPLVEEISDPDISFDLGLPTIDGVVPVDGRPGDEIVVRILTGASTLFVGLFTVLDGELERVEVTGEEAQYGNLFPSGGSVGHMEGSDCAELGIVVSLALPKGARYEVTRTHYTFSGTRLEPAATESAVVAAGRLDKYPEFGGPPFSFCTSAE